MLFAATQFIDILFFPLATLGVEKITFVEGFTEVNNFQMEYPITHGLLGSLLWALMFYILYRFVIAKGKPNAKRIAIIMGLAVLSHWFVDLIVHMYPCVKIRQFKNELNLNCYEEIKI